jgi:DNA-binding CsgD family transcriptional regulator
MHKRAATPFTREGERPLVLVPADEGSEPALASVRARLRASGWQIVAGLATRPAGDRMVLEGRVTTDDEAASAVLAAIDGYGLIVPVTLDGASLHRLEDDLRRLGTLEIVSGEPSAETHAPDPPGLAILTMLARGHTLGEAANALGISRRTADRRLAAAKAALGADRTTEAVAVAARRGLLEERRRG